MTTTPKPEALRLADELMDGMSDEHWNQLSADAAALLRTQHAAIERKDALLRKCLKHVASNITRDGCEAEELYDAIKEELQ